MRMNNCAPINLVFRSPQFAKHLFLFPTMAPAETIPIPFLTAAEALTPKLSYTEEIPKDVVTFVPDDKAFLRHTKVVQYNASMLEDKWFSSGDEFTLDFGGHRTGYLSFYLDAQGENVDCPARLRLTFGEVPGDVVEEFYPSKSWISTSWFPHEEAKIDELPGQVNIQRRHAFRYVRVQVLEVSSKFKICFRKIKCHAVTSACKKVAPVEGSDFNIIDTVGLRTLRDCMQTVFEDGPRRDRRLWLGDLRLQALVNYVTFQNNDLVKRCLYLFAGLRMDQKVMASLYERPEPRVSGDYILDYELLFVVTLLEYVEATNDISTGRELFGICQNILERNHQQYIKDGVFQMTPGVWYFIDWHDDLDRFASMQAVFVIAFKAAQSLANKLDISADYTEDIRLLSEGSLALYDQDNGVFLSNGQISWASQAWMGLAHVLPQEQHVRAIQIAMQNPDAIRANTPYCYHYVLEALFKNGARDACLALAKDYFGGMVDRGADTFWEAYREDDSTFSPYDDHHNNSFCHAWSCTVSWFLRL
ncbi:bacterial alpha-L-rhamnosidase domain-containing protein [Umbelopsis sp. AD052]|nr:bacterial alpha-L-rhamnosidase domain-containing protein [Umbelopsis sp. AD052]